MELLTYNVRMAELGLDASLGDHPYVGFLRNQDRARMILPLLKEREPEVIVFTELFAGVPRDILLEGERTMVERVVERVTKYIPILGLLVELVTREVPGEREGGLRDSGYEATERPGESSIRNGGVLIASRFDVAHWETYVFRNRTTEPLEALLEDQGIDVSQQKGVVYAALEAGDGGRYHVFGTHLQHGCDEDQLEARRDQLEELAAFVADQPVGEDEPVIVAGDFNIGWGQTGSCAEIEVADVIAAFDAAGLEAEEVQELTEPTTLGGEALDHVFLVDSMVASAEYDVLTWYQDSGDELPNQFLGPDGRRHLSDHRPLLASVRFTTNPLLDRSWRMWLDDVPIGPLRGRIP